MYNREELAWAAGFFDGEGTTYAHKSRGNCSAVSLSIGQAGRYPTQMLERFQRAIGGIGTISRGVAPKSPKHTQKWNWRIERFEEAQATVALLWPWLGPAKREQATIALKSMKSWWQNVSPRARRRYSTIVRNRAA